MTTDDAAAIGHPAISPETGEYCENPACHGGDDAAAKAAQVVDNWWDEWSLRKGPTPDIDESLKAHIAQAIRDAVADARRDAAETELEKLRSEGWMVAIHNDYQQNGKRYTFWLFTHPTGRYVKGEGETDAEAIAAARIAGAALAAFDVDAAAQDVALKAVRALHPGLADSEEAILAMTIDGYIAAALRAAAAAKEDDV